MDEMEWNGMEWCGMEWNGVHGMEWNEIVCSKLMLDPPSVQLEAGGRETRCSVDVKSCKIGARSPPK